MRIPINTLKIYDEIFTRESVFISLCVRNKPHFTRIIPEVWSYAFTQKYAIIYALVLRTVVDYLYCVPLHDMKEYFHRDYSSFAETRQRKQSKSLVATADSKEWTKRAVSSVYSLHSDAR
jgi:hypothetical protein